MRTSNGSSRILLTVSTLFALTLGLGACSSDDAAAPVVLPGSGETPAQDGPGGAIDAGSRPEVVEGGAAACDPTLATRLQADVDDASARYPKFDFLLMVKTPACGAKYLSAGPEKYPDTTLELIGSATKTYVAAAVMKLIEAGKMSLEDPASKWLKNVPGGNQAKVRHLLQHQSGFADYLSSLSLVQQLKGQTGGAFSDEELVASAFGKGLQFAPGAKWSYSNTNYIALGIIVEAVAGKPLAAAVREMLLQPLGLTHTFFAGAGDAITGAVATGLDANGAAVALPHPSLMGAAGGIFATLPDVTTWIEALCSGKVLAASSAATYVPAPVVDGWSYGYGLVAYDAKITNGGGAACGHAGNWPGFNTETYYFPATQTTVVATLNGMQAAPVRDVLLPAVEKTLFAKTPP